MAMARHASPAEASPSPPPQPLTKRDVRRNRIMEKLQGMIDAFSSNQHQHYRAQLQAVQVDMTLVMRADPYSAAAPDGPGVLSDGAEEIKELVESMGQQLPADEAAQKDYHALAGSRYQEFVQEVNDCLEQRDADLAALHNHYTASIHDLERSTRQKLHRAEEEHNALANTIRQRLIASITKKRQALLRDKEQLDISDSNALLLHPNHFSINNPGSPGNGIQNRKTRHLRHRAGSPNPGDVDGNGKRKRKFGAVEDDGNESPAPGLAALPIPDGGRSPFKDARERNVYAQYGAPAYSLEQLFTEKELTMATETARMATYRYFYQPQSQQQTQPQEGAPTSNGQTAVPSVDGEVVEPSATDGEDAHAVAAQTTETATPPPSQPPAAAEMERSTSHQVLTRGGARANPLAALDQLANAATSASLDALTTQQQSREANPFAPVVPDYHPVTRSEKSGAPPPPSVTQADLLNDFEMMRHTAVGNAEVEPEAAGGMEDDDDTTRAADLRRRLLDQALAEQGASQPFRLPLVETGPAAIGRGVERLPATGFAPLMNFEHRFIRQQVTSAAAAASATGGVGPGGLSAMAAALQGRVGGGEPMSRTTSMGGASEMGVDSAAAPPPPPPLGVGRRGRARMPVG